MGNKLGKRRQVVDDKLTRPQGLYQHKDVDIKKLRKLILDSKLAPCYPGEEECVHDLEECPICFLYYPSLNRSRCCVKGICTECFLQMKMPNSTRPTQCPFCKTSNYAVEYRGIKTKEEKGIEQIEEQRVIEAKIRMQQQELQNDEERMQKKQETSSSDVLVAPGKVGYGTAAVTGVTSIEEQEIVSSSEPCTSIRQSTVPRCNRDDEFDLDLEDIMVMEAIWLSIQENDRQRIPNHVDSIQPEQYMTETRCLSPAIPLMTETSASPSGGLACAIAALAERQQSGGESSSSYSGNPPTYQCLPSRIAQNGNSVPSHEVMTGSEREWDHGGSEVAGAGTSGPSPDATEDDGSGVVARDSQHEIEGGFQNGGGAIVSESYEDQMILAMAVSLAEARAVSSPSGVAWQ